MASEACCKRAQADSNYEPKGRYEDIAGFKTCECGPWLSAQSPLLKCSSWF